MTHHALMPNPTAAATKAYVDDLFNTIANRTCPMAVVDYAGRRDGDGEVTVTSCLRRRYGTRDMRHVAIYKLKAVKLNDAALAVEGDDPMGDHHGENV